MSSALDDDTRRTLDEGRETLFAMLRAAQKDLQKVAIVFVVGFIGTFYALRLYIWDFLKGVTKARMEASLGAEVEIIAQTPFDVILLQAKIGLAAGAILALPVLLYYTRDALRARGRWPQAPVARWKLVMVALISAVLFVLGLSYGYFLFFPFMFEFLANNALSAGFKPTYSIVKWAEFIFLLTVSFGLAAQMPLLVTGLSYTGIVQYETFREKWRYAVLGIFVFGAFFSPPDPFTQIMWAAPLLILYGLSLYLAKVVVTAKRGSERIDVRQTGRTHWNLIAGVALAGAAVVYLFFTRGGVTAVNDVFALVGSTYRMQPAGATLGVDPQVAIALYGSVVAVVAAVIALMYFVYVELAESVEPGPYGRPAAIDVGELDAAGVRAAPIEAFAALDENQAVEYASQAIDDDDQEKAQAILDRFDEAQAAAEDGDGGGAGGESSAGGGGGDIGDRASRAGSTFLDEWSDDEDVEDDIGGYYDDIVFIIDSLTSKTFRIVAVFMLVLAGTFSWLYTGGIGDVRTDFLSKLPSEVTADSVTVIALHPVEALIFEVKFSTLVAAIATVPIIAWYAWPALRNRGFVRGRRRVIFGWAAALVGGLLGGFVLGYTYVAPTVISFLANDAIQANMIISYRITDFFWLIFFTTAGIGILADVPILMLLLNRAGVSYRTMRERWREVTVALMTFAALFTPADVFTMFLVTVPLMLAYGVGLAILFVVTLGGRRDLSPAQRTPEA